MDVTPQRFQQIRQLFESVIETDATQRIEILRDVRQRDPELAAEVEGLIAASESHTEFFEKPVVAVGPVSLFEPAMNTPGTDLGSYHLIELIGIGGMGEVWRAEQRKPVRRVVALKLIKAGMDTREVVARFESERQALALMDHPAIAKVLDAGSTPEGRPYFAMEYVAGIPITSYCDQHHLTIRERLKLFIRVCEGVQHAHQKAIIHRDLKPSNILVTEVDGRPVPKIIDFGVARAIAKGLTAETLITLAGALVGTPDYMSPEQANSAGEDIDTRTDVYSLGVILYELLVGARPFDFRKLPLHEILNQLAGMDVPVPSVRFRGLAERSSIARLRETESAALLKRLRGDLDAIVLKVLEKDRSRRYGMSSELAADLTNHLHSRPVNARPAGMSYRLGKYVRRHRAAVAAASVLLLLLAFFGIAQAIQLRRITRERDRADRITNFVTGMFRVSNPSESRGNRITARELLDRASADVSRALEHEPDLQAQMMDVMGGVYYNLGLYPQAESLLTRALRIRRARLGSADVQTARSMNRLGEALDREGRRAEAEKLYHEAFAARSRRLGPDHPETLESMNSLGVLLAESGHFVEAERMHRHVLESRKRLLGPEHAETLVSIDNLGNTLDADGRFTEAEALEQEALQIRNRILGAEHPDTLRSLHHLADIFYEEGRYREAEALHSQELSTSTRVLGPEHPDTLNAMLALANVLDDEGHFVDAERLERRALAVQVRVLGLEHPDTLLAKTNLAGMLCDQRRYQEAEEMQREVIDVRARVLGSNHGHTLFTRSRLAWTLMLEGRLDEAEKMARETRELQAKVLGQEHPDTAETTCTLASVLAHRGRTTEALGLVRDAIDHGLKPAEALGIGKDPRFETIRTTPRFQELAAYARAHAAVK